MQKLAVGLLWAVLAIGCGGGSGGSGGDAPAPTGGSGTGGGTDSGGGSSDGDDGGDGNSDGGSSDGDGGGSSDGDDGNSPAPSGEFGFFRSFFIDGSLGQDCRGSYAPDTRRCSGGADTAFATFAAAMQEASPGTRFWIRSGDYQEVLRLTESGTADSFVGFVRYEQERVSIVNVDSRDNGENYGPIWLDGVQYNLVDGLRVSGSVGFLRAVDAHNNVIQNMDFDTSAAYPSASKRGGLYFAFSTYNKVLNSRIVRGTDSLSLVRSSRNLISGNTFDTAGHDVWNIKCGSYNVIRGNRFTNPDQKLGAIFDCEAATSSWHGNGAFATTQAIVDDTQYNLVEGNVFDVASDWYSTSGGNGIQYAGQRGIVRHNVFVRTNVGLGMTNYADEALYNYSNRVYHNVFYLNRCGGIGVVGTSGEGRLEDNVYKNNALWNNQGWDFDDECGSVDAGQIVYRGSLEGHQFVSNGIASDIGPAVVREEFGLGGAPSDFNDAFSGTVSEDPQFNNAANGDFTLAATSPLIDQGDFLTTAVGGGSGTELVVRDALYFYDGFGISGEMGDRIQLEGSTETAVVVSVDYASNTLTLDRALSWDGGQGVSLAFAGSAPDVGMYER